MSEFKLNRTSLLVIIAVTLIAAFLYFILIKSNSKNKDSFVKLNVSAHYENKKFTVTNNDTIDIVHADLTINEYYKIRDVNLKVGEVYTIWQVEFLHHNGTHFPPNQTPVKFSILCKLENNLTGFYHKKIQILIR